MEKKDIKKLKEVVARFNSNWRYKELLTYIDGLLDKAREEGYQDCLDDIWEEAKGLRGWAEHDGNVSATDIEAGLQEAYLNIEESRREIS